MIELEKKLQKKGLLNIVGLDEAGRGSLAGPVVAAAVIIGPEFRKHGLLKKIKDSKKLSPNNREIFYTLLTVNPNIQWGIGEVSCFIIDKINILEATKMAMRKSIKNLEKKTKKRPDIILIDGNFTINSGFKEKPIIRGDEKIISCMAAGIIAKVHRDRIMVKYSYKYPIYGLDRNKGYGTFLHRKAVEKYGHCPIHRKSFKIKK